MASPRYTLPFSISILTLMALIFLPLAAALLWLGWRGIDLQEQRSVEQRMNALHVAVSGFVANGVQVVIAAGEALAATPSFKATASVAGGVAADDERRRELIELMNRHAALAAAFVGYPNGDVLYVGRTSSFSPAERTEFGVPDDGKLLVRTIRGQGAARRENWWFDQPTAVAAGGLQSRPSDFDPRTRPWYRAAERRAAPALTDPYRFAWTDGDVGVSAGVPVEGGGVIGFDFRLGTLAVLMSSYKITPNSIIVVATGTSDVSIESEPCVPTYVDCLSGDAEVRAVLRKAAIGAGDSGQRIERTVDISGGDYRLIVQAMPPVFGKPLIVAAAVPVVELSAASRLLLERAAIVAAIMLAVAAVCALGASLLLSRSLARIAAKTQRIGQFDFSEPLPLRSRITEILKLSVAVEHMRQGLEVFGLYVSRQLVSEIMRAPGKTGLGGVRRELTVMFTDIEGFARISESIEPELLTSRLSRYFEALGVAISDNHGMIDKYIGDSVMAFWNAPQPDPDHIVNACRAALQVAAASRLLAEKWRRRERAPFLTRIGLHTGPAVVGNVGARQRLNYTLVGAVANQASRLEGLNKIYGTEILASGEVAGRTADRFVWRPVDRIVAAGTTEIMDIHEPLGEIDDAPMHADFLGAWTIAREAYAAGGFSAAGEGFRAALALRPGDRPCLLFIERCEAFVRQAPLAWDGVWRFDSK